MPKYTKIYYTKTKNNCYTVYNITEIKKKLTDMVYFRNLVAK